MASSPISIFDPSPPMSPIYEEEYCIVVNIAFSWDDLQESLRMYLDRIKEEWEDANAAISGLISDLEKWLEAPPDEAKVNPLQFLREWQVRVQEAIADGNPDLPEIIIEEAPW